MKNGWYLQDKTSVPRGEVHEICSKICSQSPMFRASSLRYNLKNVSQFEKEKNRLMTK